MLQPFSLPGPPLHHHHLVLLVHNILALLILPDLHSLTPALALLGRVAILAARVRLHQRDEVGSQGAVIQPALEVVGVVHVSLANLDAQIDERAHWQVHCLHHKFVLLGLIWQLPHGHAAVQLLALVDVL